MRSKEDLARRLEELRAAARPAPVLVAPRGEPAPLPARGAPANDATPAPESGEIDVCAEADRDSGGTGRALAIARSLHLR